MTMFTLHTRYDGALDGVFTTREKAEAYLAAWLAACPYMGSDEVFISEDEVDPEHKP